jgi:putative aldouronate transport system substrate-binding protein
MDELGLALPATPDELLDVMIKMKEQDPNRLVYTSYEGMKVYGDLLSCLMGCWGLGNRGSLSRAGTDAYWDADPDDWSKVRFMPTSAEFKEMLILVNKMYAAGCIDPDALTQEETVWGAKTAQKDPAIIGMSTNDVLDVYMCEEDYIGVPALTGPGGGRLFSAVNNQTNRPWNYLITKNCKEVPLAVEFADYWMSEEGSILFFKGAEGVHWEWNDDHTRRDAMEWQKKDPGGRSEDQMRSTWTNQPGGSYFGYNIPQPPDLKYNYIKACEELKPFLPQIVWPIYSLNIEESSISSTIGVDITTHYSESVVNFISGRISLEKDWDAYVKRFNDMGLSKLRDVYQAAYDRYLASGGQMN